MNTGSPVHLVVAACTYHRPDGLRALLDALARQTFSYEPVPNIELLIVDNACSEETARICNEFSRVHPAIALHCFDEPRKGISYARNTVLDRIPAHCDFLALIDDDEIPDETWLDALFAAQNKSGADIVRGPVIADYAPGTPEWVVGGGYYGWPIDPHDLKDGQLLNGGATNNVLLFWPAVRETGIRFDPELAHTGGEDAVFFHQLMTRGMHIIFAAQARVTENIPESRTTLVALLRLNYRLGANRLLKQLRLLSANKGRFRLVLVHLGKGLRHIISGSYKLLRAWLPAGKGRAGTNDALLDLARGMGHFAGLFGFRYRYYK